MLLRLPNRGAELSVIIKPLRIKNRSTPIEPCLNGFMSLVLKYFASTFRRCEATTAREASPRHNWMLTKRPRHAAAFLIALTQVPKID